MLQPGQPLAGLEQAGPFNQAFADFIERYGHRGPNDWEISSRTWENTPELAYEIKQFVEENRALYPDIQATIEDSVIQGNRSCDDLQGWSTTTRSVTCLVWRRMFSCFRSGCRLIAIIINRSRRRCPIG